MITQSILVRRGREQDLLQINEIFNWHSENGFSTFSQPTSIDQRREWFNKFKNNERHILLIAESGSDLLGFACSFSYRDGGVFKNTLETSIYLNSQAIGKGLGTKLYEKLFEELNGKGVHRVVVGIAIPNEKSIVLHKKFGFDEIGIFDEYAFYKGQYRSSMWMQKKLNDSNNL